MIGHILNTVADGQTQKYLEVFFRPAQSGSKSAIRPRLCESGNFILFETARFDLPNAGHVLLTRTPTVGELLS